AGLRIEEAAGEDLPNHPGVALLRSLVDCGARDSKVRDASRRRLAGLMKSVEPWEESWCRFHLGASQLGESGLGQRQRGMLNLLHLPGRFAASQPYLAGLALAMVTEVLGSTDRAEAAASLRAELTERYPGHSVHAAIAEGVPLVSIFTRNEDNS
ncbi:MAG: hypothetical protein JSV91_01945, partial [Phycisphaerales bacterium]